MAGSKSWGVVCWKCWGDLMDCLWGLCHYGWMAGVLWCWRHIWTDLDNWWRGQTTAGVIYLLAELADRRNLWVDLLGWRKWGLDSLYMIWWGWLNSSVPAAPFKFFGREIWLVNAWMVVVFMCWGVDFFLGDREGGGGALGVLFLGNVVAWTVV